MANFDSELDNPGEALRSFLFKLFPSDEENRESNIAKIDAALVAEGKFASLVYRSAINYMLRRILTAAVLIERKCDQNHFSDEILEKKLRAYIANNLNIPGAKNVDKLTGLITNCLKTRHEKITQTTEKSVKQRNENLCYICGKTMSFGRDNGSDSATLEHVFPRLLGGSSKAHNLRYACKICNETKADNIDESDYHYEEICLLTDEDDETKFHRDLSRVYKIAAWAKSDYKCQLCGKSASVVGRLDLVRREQRDNWHFLNIEAYCSVHVLQMRKRRKNQSIV